MCKKVDNAEIKAEVKKAEEVPVEAPKAEPVEKKEEMPDTSCQAIGHVSIPGSGTGKGTVVKK